MNGTREIREFFSRVFHVSHLFQWESNIILAYKPTNVPESPEWYDISLHYTLTGRSIGFLSLPESREYAPHGLIILC